MESKALLIGFSGFVVGVVAVVLFGKFIPSEYQASEFNRGVQHGLSLSDHKLEREYLYGWNDALSKVRSCCPEKVNSLVMELPSQ